MIEKMPRVQVSGFRVQVSGFRNQGTGFGVEGSSDEKKRKGG